MRTETIRYTSGSLTQKSFRLSVSAIRLSRSRLPPAIEQKQNDWLEPLTNWIKVASNLVKIARDSNLLQKKVAAKEIFGSNLRGDPVFPHLSALRAAELVGKMPESQILVPRRGLEPPTP